MSDFKEVKANTNSISKRKLVLGVGVNDSYYITDRTINGKRMRCPYYMKWLSMLSRCYNEKYQARQPTYAGATVCKEWLTFSVFKAWMIDQEWQGKDLDKDIINPGNKHYSPDSCCFVSGRINALLNNCSSSRGEYPQGVNFNKQRGKYQAYCNYAGKIKHLGRFKTVNAASLRYRLFKSQLVRKLAQKQTDERIEHGLMQHAKLILYGA